MKKQKAVKPKQKGIILNKMYSGDYLKKGNLGHEVINLYKSDNGNNYIYLLYDGRIKKEYKDKVSCLLLVRQYPNNLIEILAKATGLHEIYDEKIEKQDNDYQEKFITDNNITYGGVSLNDIFQGDDYQKISITYQADNVVLPKKPIYVQYAMGQNNELPTLKGINRGQASHQFVYPYNEEAHTNLSDIINDKEAWGEEVKTVKETREAMKDLIPPRTIFDITRTSYSELSYSSALGYYLRNDKEFADKFINEVLGIPAKLDSNYKVFLETVHRIDIFITDKDKAIIIENKVKSAINGVYTDQQKTKRDNQLERYFENVRDDDKFAGKTIYPFLLTPDYNKIDISNLKYPYVEIKYSELYKVMRGYKAYGQDPDFTIFTDAVQKHISEFDNGLRDEMFRLFFDRLDVLT